MFFVNKEANREVVYGSKPYTAYESALQKLHPKASKRNYNKDWQMIFSKYGTLTAKEFSELTETPRRETEPFLNKLVNQEKLEKSITKNGSIWKMKSSSF